MAIRNPVIVMCRLLIHLLELVPVDADVDEAEEDRLAKFARTVCSAHSLMFREPESMR